MCSEIFAKLRALAPDWGGALPEDWSAPTLDDFENIHRKYGCRYPPSFIAFQTQHAKITPMGDRDWDGFGWANPDVEPYLSLEVVIQRARKMGVPSHLSPFRVDEGNYYCFDTSQSSDGDEYPVVFWDHDEGNILSVANYQWESFCDWLLSGLHRSLAEDAGLKE